MYLSQHAPLMYCSFLSLRLCLTEKPLSEQADTTVPPSILFSLSHCCSGGKSHEWDRIEGSQDASSSHVLLPSPVPAPYQSIDRYAAVGRGMEVWINLTTAGSDCERMRRGEKVEKGQAYTQETEAIIQILKTAYSWLRSSCSTVLKWAEIHIQNKYLGK